MGQLIPVSRVEVLPGDSMRIGTSALVRLAPLQAPVMHPVQVRFHSWYVPHRLLWDGWEDFITGGPDGDNNTTPPTITLNGTVSKGSLADYLGIPPGDYSTNPVEVLAFPFLAYQLIWNEFYRDQDLQTELTLGAPYNILNCAWEKDYFTSSRPFPQKGPDITLPLGTSADIKYRSFSGTGTEDDKWAVQVRSGSTVQFNYGDTANVNTGQVPDPSMSNMYADLSSASAVNVNDVRLAFAMQRYQEARARYGSRFSEYLRYLGVRPSDQRLQRPEYITGGKQTIAFSEVVQSFGEEGATNNALGRLGGHGIAALRSRRGIKFFEEHGTMLTLMSVRPKTIYSDGIHRDFLRMDKEDFWQMELQHIGQQPIDNKEVYATGTAGTFGYQDRYDEYRRMPSGIAGDFRDTLNFWHLARQFASQPALNEDFIKCVPSPRIFAEQTTPPLWVMVNNNIQARRLVSASTASRIM